MYRCFVSGGEGRRGEGGHVGAVKGDEAKGVERRDGRRREIEGAWIKMRKEEKGVREEWGEREGVYIQEMRRKVNEGTKQRGRKRINGGGKGDKERERVEEIRWMSGEDKRRREE